MMMSKAVQRMEEQQPKPNLLLGIQELMTLNAEQRKVLNSLLGETLNQKSLTDGDDHRPRKHFKATCHPGMLSSTI